MGSPEDLELASGYLQQAYAVSGGLGALVADALQLPIIMRSHEAIANDRARVEAALDALLQANIKCAGLRTLVQVASLFCFTTHALTSDSTAVHYSQSIRELRTVVFCTKRGMLMQPSRGVEATIISNAHVLSQTATGDGAQRSPPLLPRLPRDERPEHSGMRSPVFDPHALRQQGDLEPVYTVGVVYRCSPC